MNTDPKWNPCSSVAKESRYLAVAGSNSGVGLKLAPVILHEVFLLSVTEAGIELILIHLCQDLLQIPFVVVEAINRTHHARPVTSTGTMNIKLTGLRIVNCLQERIDLIHAGIALINHRNVDVTKAGAFDRRLLVCSRIVG